MAPTNSGPGGRRLWSEVQSGHVRAVRDAGLSSRWRNYVLLLRSLYGRLLTLWVWVQHRRLRHLGRWRELPMRGPTVRASVLRVLLLAFACCSGGGSHPSDGGIPGPTADGGGGLRDAGGPDGSVWVDGGWDAGATDSGPVVCWDAGALDSGTAWTGFGGTCKTLVAASTRACACGRRVQTRWS